VTAGFDAVRVSPHRSSCCAAETKVCVGPIARTVADLRFASKTMINLAQDPASGLAGENIMPIPWRDVDMPERLKIGYFIETGGVKVRSHVTSNETLTTDESRLCKSCYRHCPRTTQDGPRSRILHSTRS